ncbi:hypothetical protein [Thiohalorhabdus sp.]|uniref:hypothetical protein n=1 Tax=Thiohalorhabdus sp. TaxID=3094134 RepID=UPI002FC2AB50
MDPKGNRPAVVASSLLVVGGLTAMTVSAQPDHANKPKEVAERAEKGKDKGGKGEVHPGRAWSKGPEKGKAMREGARGEAEERRERAKEKAERKRERAKEELEHERERAEDEPEYRNRERREGEEQRGEEGSLESGKGPDRGKANRKADPASKGSEQGKSPKKEKSKAWWNFLE